LPDTFIVCPVFLTFAQKNKGFFAGKKLPIANPARFEHSEYRFGHTFIISC